MDISLLQLFSKWLGIICISSMSLFGIGNYDEQDISISNVNENINVNIVNYVKEHDTVIEYNPKLPSNVSKVKVKGVDEIKYKVLDDKNSELKLLQSSVTEVVEKGSGAYGLYTGVLTGYSADCGAGCSGNGYLACRTESKEKFSIKYDGIYYEDSEYGKVRIVSGPSTFPCGTIVQISKQNDEPYYAVVMDRGGTMNSQWAKGILHLDLAFESNDVIIPSGLTGKNINFSVQRWGW